MRHAFPVNHIHIPLCLCTSLPLPCKVEISQKEIVSRVDVTVQNNSMVTIF